MQRQPLRKKATEYYNEYERQPLRSKGNFYYHEESTNEYHLPFHNYAGPGTHIKERIDRGDKPINSLDAAALVHDIEYLTGKQNDADSNMIKNLWYNNYSVPAIPLAANIGFKVKDIIGYKPDTNDSLAEHLKGEVYSQNLLNDYPRVTFNDQIIPTVFGQETAGVTGDF